MNSLNEGRESTGSLKTALLLILAAIAAEEGTAVAADQEPRPSKVTTECRKAVNDTNGTILRVLGGLTNLAGKDFERRERAKGAEGRFASRTSHNELDDLACLDTNGGATEGALGCMYNAVQTRDDTGHGELSRSMGLAPDAYIERGNPARQSANLCLKHLEKRVGALERLKGALSTFLGRQKRIEDEDRRRREAKLPQDTPENIKKLQELKGKAEKLDYNDPDERGGFRGTSVQ